MSLHGHGLPRSASHHTIRAAPATTWNGGRGGPAEANVVYMRIFSSSMPVNSMGSIYIYIYYRDMQLLVLGVECGQVAMEGLD